MTDFIATSVLLKERQERICISNERFIQKFESAANQALDQSKPVVQAQECFKINALLKNVLHKNIQCYENLSES